MKRQGTLVRWEKDRGFGFIRCAEISADVFVHLRDFADRGSTPQVGMKLTFEEIHVGGKGPRAVAVQAVGAVRQVEARQAEAPQQRRQRHIAAAPRQRPVRASGSRGGGGNRGGGSGGRDASFPQAMVLLLAVYAALLGYGVWTARLPAIALGVLLLLSLLTFFAYGFDKNAAEAGRWRTPENTLHMLSLVGGWPGAWAAQRLFRHKVRKASFMAAYWATVLAHMAAVGAWVGKLLPADLLAFAS
jgi:uncharacterized membrane protein YsdA (DUF1294 family)/cold shock CspA family protein